jgi:hypothetical protein
MRIVSKTGTLGLCVVAVVEGLSLKYDVQFRYMFLFSFIFLMDSANGKIMVLLSSVLCILLPFLPLALVKTVSPSDILHLSLAIQYHEKE